MTMQATRLIVVEDDLRALEVFRDAHAATMSQLAKAGGSLPPIVFRSSDTAMRICRLARGGGELPWESTDCLLIDCLDWEGARQPRAGSRTVAFVLDLLAQLRALQAEGTPVPRVVTYSLGMSRPALQAALSEFQAPTIEITLNRDDVPKGLRRDRSPNADREGGLLWAMFDRDVLIEHLHDVARGVPTGALGPLPDDHPAWADVTSASCLASFHSELRDRMPAVWDSHVLGPVNRNGLEVREKKRINRMALEFLEPNPERGRPTYKGYLELARQLANPA